MRKAVCVALALLLCAALAACGGEAAPALPSPPAELTPAPVEPEVLPEPEAEPVPSLPPVPQWPEAEIAPVDALYSFPGMTHDELCACFSEAVFSSYEYSEELDSLNVVKWSAPVLCRLSGDVDSTDIAAIREMISALQDVPGFPGISYAEDEQTPNLTVTLCSRAEFMKVAAADTDFEESDSFLSVSYDDASGEINGADIYIRTDTMPYVRSALIHREMLRSLGLFGEILHRSDSILSPSYSHNPTPTGLDDILLSILYDSRIACGADSVSCMAYVRALCIG